MGLVVVVVLFLVLYRQFRERSSGVSFLLFRLRVVRHVGRLLDGNVGPCFAELVKDGDLILIINRMLDMRGRHTVLFSKVEGHADEGMVRDGGVREIDRIGYDAADEVADFGWRRVDFLVIDARRKFL